MNIYRIAILNLCLICLFGFHPLARAEKQPIAVLDLDAKGVGLEKGVADVITEKVRDEFGRYRDFYDLVAREKMEQLAKEKAIQLSGCTELTCAVQIGKALNVQKLVVGSVGKLGQKYLIFLRVIDVEKENVECSAAEEMEIRVEEISTLTPYVVRKIVACLSNKPIPPESTLVMKAVAPMPPIRDTTTVPSLTYLRVNEKGYKEYRNEKDGSILLEIPAGDFIMGSEEGDKDEEPMRKVSLDRYYIGKNEVTVGQFRKFCEATGKKMPSQPDWNTGENYPIDNLTWEDAKAYCDWADLKLPSEAEWEKAARGVDGRRYPWGNEWDSTACNSKGNRDGVKLTAPVGSFTSGISPYGAFDMAGNVTEWCKDWYKDNYYRIGPHSNPIGPSSGDYHVFRGGSWKDDEKKCRSSFRNKVKPTASRRFETNQPFSGFRVAK